MNGNSSVYELGKGAMCRLRHKDAFIHGRGCNAIGRTIDTTILTTIMR